MTVPKKTAATRATARASLARSALLQQGMSLAVTAKIVGCTAKTLTSYVTRGWLRATVVNKSASIVTMADLRKFLRAHPRLALAARQRRAQREQRARNNPPTLPLDPAVASTDVVGRGT